MPRSYPSDEQARETFNDAEYEAACAKMRASDRNDVVVVHLFQSKLETGITTDIAHVVADLCREIPGTVIRSVYDGLAIVRTMTVGELRDAVLQDRKSEMWYSEDSPHYIPKSERK